jgi:hypothetical protein
LLKGIAQCLKQRRQNDCLRVVGASAEQFVDFGEHTQASITLVQSAWTLYAVQRKKTIK